MTRTHTLVTLTFVLGLLHTSSTAQQLASPTSFPTGHLTRSQLAGMKNTTRTLIQLVHDYIATDACDPTWHGDYFAGRSASGPLLKFGAQCSFFTLEHAASKKAELLLLANDLGPLFGHVAINGNDYLTTRAAITRRNGCLYFELPQNAETSGHGLATSFWLVTADSSRLPYLPVTRREWLLEIRKQLSGDTNSIAAEWRRKITVRPAAEQEAEKQRQLRVLQTLYSGTDLQVRTNLYLQSFVSDEAYLRRQINTATALHRSTLRTIDSLLHSDPADLKRPTYLSEETTAVLSGTDLAHRSSGPGQAAAALSFHGFADSRPGAILLVRPNPAATDPYLSEEKPQFLLLGWRFDPTDPLAASLDGRLHDNLDGRELKQLLGK
ncbi:hypothetical protein [Puia sp.]|jgi:hypothetical protein|uniref:hypothetical protein n=1 Tax=Puia sp. TaxID=2045100 RepID=UPI002F3F7446